MCGRFTLRTPLREVADAFDLAPTQLPSDDAWRARYNIAPTQHVAAVRQSSEGQRELTFLQWGLIPSWADDPTIGSRMINARSETLATKPAYRDAFRRRRCLVVADGFFEWKQGAKPKQPFYIGLEKPGLLAFAGLWENWHHGELKIQSCTIVTTSANSLLRPLHERMPVILDSASYDQWLDPEFTEPEPLEKLLVPYPAERMRLYPVGSLVNSPRNDSPDCVAQVAPPKVQGTLFD